eukprot:3498133-Pleurochrysis_carterae.AAC.1
MSTPHALRRQASVAATASASAELQSEPFRARFSAPCSTSMSETGPSHEQSWRRTHSACAAVSVTAAASRTRPP